MSSRLRWRIVVTLMVTLGISIFGWYPLVADRLTLEKPSFLLEKRLRLGLDLKGGVHMVLRVNTDDAVLVETRNASRRVEEALTRQGVKAGPVEVLGPGRFRVLNVSPEGDTDVSATLGRRRRWFSAASPPGRPTHSRSAERLCRDYAPTRSRRPGTPSNGGLTVLASRNRSSPSRVRPAMSSSCSCQVSPTWTARGTSWERPRCSNGNSSNEVQPRRARPCLLTPAVWFRHTRRLHLASRPPCRAIPLPTTSCEAAAEITGRDLRNARPTAGENNQPAVAFSLTQEGARRFAQLTRRQRRPLAGDHPGRAGAVGAAD